MTMNIICRPLLRGIARAAVFAGALLFCAHAQAQSSDYAAVSSLSATGSDGNALQFDRAFHRTAFSYSTAVPSAVDSVKVTAVSDGAGVTMAIGATVLTDNTESAAIPLAKGANELLLIATAQDGAATTTYRLSITRAGAAATNNARLASLRFDYGELDSAFVPGTPGYTAALLENLSRVIVVPEDAGATIMLSGSATAGNGDIPSTAGALASGVPSGVLTIPDSGTSMLIVEVTASDGAANMRYQVAITKKTGDVATLNKIIIFSCVRSGRFCAGRATSVTPTYHPPFSPDDPDSLNYEVILPSGTRAAHVFNADLTHPEASDEVPVLSDVESTIFVPDDFSLPIDFSSASKFVSLVVTAEDATTVLTYFLEVSIAAAAKTELTITPMDAEKVYGAADPALIYTATFTGDDDHASVFSAIPFVRAPGEDAGDYAYQLKDPLPFASAAAAAKYAVSPITGGGDFTITKHQIDIRESGADKPYDGNSHPPADFPPPLGALGPLMLGDVSIDDTTPDRLRLRGCAFADADVGDDKAITGCVLAGAASGNYMLNANISGDITAKTVSAAAVTLTKTYDANTALTGAALSGGAVSGVVLGESLALALAENPDDVFASADAGGSISVTITGAQDFVLASGDSGATKLENYKLPANIAVTGVITAKRITATADPATATKVYDGDDTAPSGITADFTAGDIESADTGNVSIEFGVYDNANVAQASSVGIRLVGTAEGNYELTATGVPATITAKRITATVDPATATKIYDGDDTAPSGITATFAVGDIIAADTGNVSIEFSVYDNANVAQASSVGISLVGTAEGNYELTAAGVPATITAKRITATADPATATKIYDGDDTAPSGITAAFAVGDILTADTGNVSIEFSVYDNANVAQASSVGIRLVGTAAGNYELTAASVPATITAKRITATVDPATATKIYDGDDTAPSGITADFTAGDIETVDDGNVSIEFGVYDNANVVQASSVGIRLVGTAEGNYALTAATVPATITTKPVTATNVTGASKVYDGTPAAPSGIAADFTTGDIESVDDGKVSIEFGDYDSANVSGASTVDISLSGDSAGNYHLTAAAATVPATITKRTLRVTASGSGGAAPGDATLSGHSLLTAGTAAGEGLVASQTLANVLTGKLAIGAKSGATARLTQNTLALQGSAPGNNYTLLFTPGDYTFIQTLVITPIAPTLTRVYGETAPAALSYSIAPNAESFFIGVDTAETAFFDANPLMLPAGNSDAGEYDFAPVSPLPAKQEKADVYLFTLAQDVKYTITPKEVAVADVMLTKTYDGDDTFGASVIQSGGEVTGEITGEALLLAADGPATYENANAGANKSVGGVVFALAGDSAATKLTKPANYALPASIAVTGEITVKQVTATATTATATKTYDAGVAAPPGIAATFDTDDIVSADAGDAGKIRIVFGDYNSANVADAATVGISLAGTSMDNYELTAPATVAAVITKRNLRVTANNVVVAGEADRPAAADLSVRVGDAGGEGYASGEGAAEAFTGDLAYGADADNTAPIEQGDLAATGNYEIASFIDGVLTIGIIFDADGSAGADATDGVLIARYLLGLRGDALTAGIKDDLETGATAESIATTLKAAVEATGSKYDVDRNNSINAADGIMIARYLLGVTEGAGLTAGQTDAAHATVAKNIADTLPASQ